MSKISALYQAQRGFQWQQRAWYGARRLLARNSVRTACQKVVTYHQRGRRGWAVSDTWNLDSYLTQVISGSVDYLRQHTQGHPSGMTKDEWDTILSKIATGITAWESIDDLDFRTDAYAEYRAQFEEAIRLLGKFYPHLWD